jgi:hypothetical protein
MSTPQRAGTASWRRRHGYRWTCMSAPTAYTMVGLWARAEIVAPAATAAARYWRARECKVWSFQVRMRAAQSAPIMGPRPSPR